MKPTNSSTDYGVLTANINQAFLFAGISNCNQGEVPYKILNIEKPMKIREQICTVLTVPDIEDAERICLTWNHHLLNEKEKQRLKAHVHPFSYRKRPLDKPSLHTIFKDYYNPNLIMTNKSNDPSTIVKSE